MKKPGVRQGERLYDGMNTKKEKKETGTESKETPSMTDLHKVLFQQVERLNKPDLTGEELRSEVDRSKAITGVAQTMVNNARLQLEATLKVGDKIRQTEMPKMLK